MQRDTRIVAFYKSRTWKRVRDNYRNKIGLCEDCFAKGIYTPGEIVHHIEHVTVANITNPEITLNPNNLKLVCRKCHADEHPDIYGKEKRRYEVVDGKVIIKAD